MKWYIESLKWILSSIGVTGFLLTIGFVIDLSFQNRLGYQTTGLSSAAYYVSMAGTFFVDCLILVLESIASSITFVSKWIESHIIITATSVLVIGVSVLCVIKCEILRYAKNKVPYVIVPIFLVMCAFLSLLYFDVPTIKLNGMLVKQPTSGYELSNNYFERRTNAFFRFQKLSRISDSSNERECYIRKNKNYFLFNMASTLVCVILAVIAYTVSSRGLLLTTYPKVKDLLTFLSLVGVLMACVKILALPYSYAKTYKSTVFNEAILYIDNPQNKVGEEHGYILSENDKEIILFHKVNQKLWRLRKDKVRYSKIEGTYDVLTAYFLYQKAAEEGSQNEPKKSDK